MSKMTPRLSVTVLLLVMLLCLVTYVEATPWGGVGNYFVRTHRFTIKGTNVHSAMFNAGRFRGANLTTLLAFAETTPQAQAAGAAGVPWVACIQPGPTGVDEYFRQRVSQAAACPHCEGWLIYDEPSRLRMPYAKAAADWVRKASPNTLVYAVALPSYAPASLLYGDNSHPGYTWPTYLDDFIAIIKPDILSYDNYPFLANGTTRSNFFYDLMTVREKGLRANLSFFAFLQTWAYQEWRLPSESDIRMQAYAHLAAGYSGLAYFTYDYNQAGGLLDIYGNPSALYYYAKKLNVEIHNLGEALRYLTSTDVRFLQGKNTSGAVNPVPRGLTAWNSWSGGDPHIINAAVDSRLAVNRGRYKNGLLGFFKDDAGRRYFMVVNLSHGPGLTAANATLPIWIKFDNSVNSLVEVDRQTAQGRTVNLTNHELYVKLLGGTGRLYRFVSKD